MRRAAKRDASEESIVQYLRKAGWSVAYLSGTDLPDLLLGKDTAIGKLNLLAEVKTGKKPLRPGQQQFADNWHGMPPFVLRSVEDAEALNRMVNFRFSL